MRVNIRHYVGTGKTPQGVNDNVLLARFVADVHLESLKKLRCLNETQVESHGGSDQYN